VTGSSPTGTVDFKDGGSSISGCSARPFRSRHLRGPRARGQLAAAPDLTPLERATSWELRHRSDPSIRTVPPPKGATET
jgi:hypothetical protein